MRETKRIFIDYMGGLNFNNRGRLASIEDLEFAKDELNQAFEGLLQVEEGIYYYISNKENKEILKSSDDEITQEELEEIDEEGGEYYKINSQSSELYQEFLEDLDDVMEEIITVSFDNGDNLLCSLTKGRNESVSYIYNYSRNLENKGKITKTTVMIPTSMLNYA